MVTGGCGFIGAYLVELLANNNLEVISIDHKERAEPYPVVPGPSTLSFQHRRTRGGGGAGILREA